MDRIDFRKEKIPFTQVANTVLNDPELSAKAKGLYAYLYSKPDGWDYAIDRIARDFTDGRKSINSGLQELEHAGYLLRQRQASGRVLYVLSSQMPKTDIRHSEPHAPFGKVPKRSSAETGTISNTDGKAIKSNINKERYGELNNVLLAKEEHAKLVERYGPTAIKQLINELSTYIPNAKTQYRDHYAVLLNWARRKGIEEVRKPPPVEVSKLTPEEVERNRKRLASIRANLAAKMKM